MGMYDHLEPCPFCGEKTLNASILLRKAECVKDGTVAEISVYSDGLMPNYKLELFPDSASAKYAVEEIQKDLFKIVKCRADLELKLGKLTITTKF